MSCPDCHEDHRETDDQQHVPRGTEGHASRSLVGGLSAARDSVNEVVLLPQLPVVYPYLDRQSRGQLRQLDRHPSSPSRCSRCEQVRQAAEVLDDGQQAGGSSCVSALGLQTNSLPPQGPLGTVTQPEIQQGNNVDSAQASALNAAAHAPQILMAPQDFSNDPIQDQPSEPSVGSSPSPTLLPYNASTTSLTSVPELSEDGGSAISELPRTPRTPESLCASPASPVDSQSSVIVGRAEIPSIDASMSSVLSNNSNFSSDFFSCGLVFNPINGTYRRRLMTDDFPGLTRVGHKRQWDRYMEMAREQRPYVELYEEGDSDLELSDWEAEKEIRKKNRMTSPR